MPRKHYQPEEIIKLLRLVEIEVGHGAGEKEAEGQIKPGHQGLLCGRTWWPVFPKPMTGASAGASYCRWRRCR